MERIIKGSGDRLTTAGFVAMASDLVSLLLLPIVGLPNAASIPWAIGAALVHLFYFVCLIEAYDHGDLGQVYPLARGGAPLMTGVMRSLFIEQINAAAWAGLLLLAFGVLILALPCREAGRNSIGGRSDLRSLPQ